jgi:hypothetical protein
MRSVRPIEVFAILSVLAVSALLWASYLLWRGRSDNRPECAYNLRSLYGGYNNFIATHGAFVTEVSTNAGGTKEFAAQEGMAHIHFRALVSSYFTPVSQSYPPIHILICPKDQREAAPISSISNSNISYFLSQNPPVNSPKWVLAGNRNISFNSPGSSNVVTERRIQWDPKVGLHGDTGYLLLLDGSVMRANNDELNSSFSEAGNVTNRIAVP